MPLAVTSCALFLAGCPDTGGESCEGLLFDDPLAELWADYEEGDRLAFTGPNATAEYAVTSVEDLPSTGLISIGSDDEVPCITSRRIVLTETNGDLQIGIRLERDEPTSRPPRPEIVSASVSARLPAANIATDLGLIWLKPFGSNETAGSGQRIVEDLMLADRSYGLSVVFPEVNSANEPYLSRPDRIESFAFSEGFGLSFIERADVGPLYLDEVVRADGE